MKKTTLLLASTLFISPVLASKNAQSSELSLSDLLSIKLTTGSFLELDLMNSSVSMTVINDNQIRYSGARHLSELLEVYVPGFQYMYNKWNGEIWGMRGVAADRNTKFIFLVNGHKMNHESRDGAMAEISLGMFGDLARVEVLRGPAGLVYGSGAIAGVVNIVTKEYEEDKVELNAKFGTWNLQTTSKEFEALLARDLGDDQQLTIGMGYRASEGVGAEETRITGRAHWPFPQDGNNVPENGLPSAGSAWSTPGNWKASVDYQWGNLSVYSRMTHQVSNAGGLFPVDAWPEVFGDVTPKTTTLGFDTISPGQTAPIGGILRNTISGTDSEGNTISQDIYEVIKQSGSTDRTTTMVDGKVRDADYFGIASENWNTNRRQYVVDNIMAETKYAIPLGENELQLKASVDAATNRIQREERKGYELSGPEERNTFIEETFGEKRFGLGFMYLLKSVENLQLATGYEFRLDKIGDDLTGKNSQAEKGNHPIVSEVEYTNNAFFIEGIFDLNDQMAIHGGLRYDIHTRTIDDGGVISPKFAFIYKPNENHSFKFIYQTSSNNGSADNYEYNRNNYDDNGEAYASYHFEKPYELPGGNSPVIAGVTEDALHSLKPEKTTSYELTSVHLIGDNLTASPSVSYNSVENLFTWSQPDFRVVNAGAYNFINAEIDLKYSGEKFTIGMSHTHQNVVNTDIKGQEQKLTGPEFDQTSVDANGNPDWYETKKDANGKTYYVPKSTGTVTQTVNPLLDQITVDGENFLNLTTDLSKIYVDYRLFDSFVIHTDARIFWGLVGRTDIHEYETDANGKVISGGNEYLNNDTYKGIYGNNTNFNYHDIEKDVMTKWNASLNWELEDDLKIGLYVYDILADDEGGNAIHSLRWQQSGNSKEHTDLFGVDQRSYAISIQKNF